MDLLDWGLVEYQEALLRQESLLEEIAQKQSPGALVFCQHPPIVTLGRSTKPGDVTTWSGPVLEVSRGGRATYHGPSQLVIYPIINLSIPGHSRAAKDIGAYLRNFEQAIVACLKDYGIEAEGRSLQKKSPEIEAGDETGVWVGVKKIASLGIGVRKWVTFHGAALNVFADPAAFQGLNPCGFQSSVMVSIEGLTGKKIDLAILKTNLRAHLEKFLGG
ncbi:MAG: lipoyl(octanoyl) transferase LipB [Bdellovibrionaceae bacterium]|nr:lipoyl(octanoyl) transferase LipB [Pseudobdellovibrionaceae bacterium]